MPNKIASDNRIKWVSFSRIELKRWIENKRESEELVIEGEHIPYGGIVSDDVGLDKTLLAISTILENPTQPLII